MATSFSGGGSRSTQREPPTLGKQLVNCITCGCELSAPFFVIYKAGREPMKPKKPVGGVSMFGGFDPTSALKKRQEKNVPQKGKINFVFKPIC
jgi:hypothetical protein